MEKTIKVTGKGKVSVKLDWIRLSIKLEEVYEKYKEALQQSSKQTEQLKLCFETIGFLKEDLKTLLFHINAQYENYQDKKSIWKKKFVGYDINIEPDNIEVSDTVTVVWEIQQAG